MEYAINLTFINHKRTEGVRKHTEDLIDGFKKVGFLNNDAYIFVNPTNELELAELIINVLNHYPSKTELMAVKKLFELSNGLDIIAKIYMKELTHIDELF